MSNNTGNMEALSAQLRAEIQASDFRSLRRVAQELDVEYYTFRKWMQGDKNLRMDMVFRVLDLLTIEPAVFFARVQERRDHAND